MNGLDLDHRHFRARREDEQGRGLWQLGHILEGWQRLLSSSQVLPPGHVARPLLYRRAGLCEVSCVLDAAFRFEDFREPSQTEQRLCPRTDSGATMLGLAPGLRPGGPGTWSSLGCSEHSSGHLLVHLQQSWAESPRQSSASPSAQLAKGLNPKESTARRKRACLP